MILWKVTEESNFRGSTGHFDDAGLEMCGGVVVGGVLAGNWESKAVKVVIMKVVGDGSKMELIGVKMGL